MWVNKRRAAKAAEAQEEAERRAYEAMRRSELLQQLQDRTSADLVAARKTIKTMRRQNEEAALVRAREGLLPLEWAARIDVALHDNGTQVELTLDLSRERGDAVIAGWGVTRG